MTLIDIYKTAKKTLNPSKLKSYVEKLDYTYPYHQVIGFYLDVSGYGKDVTDLFLSELNFDFYLTYDM